MALFGYTIGEDRDQNASNGKQLDVYRFLIPNAPTTTPITPTGPVGTVTIAGTVTTADLEGLGTNPTTGRVTAINETRVTGSTTPIDPTVFIVNNVDQPFAPVNVPVVRTPSDLRRFGFESGADFGRDFSVASQPIVHYTIAGNRSASNGVPVGSSLYKITLTNPAISIVDNTPTTPERLGTQPTNTGKFADGLAIDNLTPGRTRAFASDLSTADGDGAQLYKVDLLTGQLSAPINLRNSSGQPLSVNSDSGLAFSNVTGSTQRLFAWEETGRLYEITGFQDELNASGLTLGSTTGTNGAGFATATLLATVNLPNASTGVVDYEGFTIANE
ncbi:hypothetical protein [aff. Roholtiella sp. LEGE 12411]|uniref:hypothetical protein n=1 Tax=aff. Roholtiella sp. LEGE 12411 TaxID=1828822 RepID=UPI00187DF181|nr:hypothetical protein [aff. Roholtiella sp. LEGE 12411]MBE9037181.1 hypothetical protein [aff. Roholtiella sp. LEGE 12411]